MIENINITQTVTKKGYDIDRNKLLGIVCVFIFVFISIPAIILLFIGYGMSLLDVALIIFSVHVINKTLCKKQKLTKGEWIVFFVLVAIMMAGIIILIAEVLYELI